MFNWLMNRIPSISVNELNSRISKEITILDVRTSSEYGGGHIPMAKNVPLNKIDRYNEQVGTIYIICQSGVRSRQATKKLRKKGYEAINVRGGMNQWTGKIRGGK